MMPWFFRYFSRMLGVLAAMLFVEYITFVISREMGISRFFFLPISLGLVAFAGYDTVARLPLLWGSVIGGILYGITSVLSWEIGNYVLQGRWQLPDEANHSSSSSPSVSPRSSAPSSAASPESSPATAAEPASDAPPSRSSPTRPSTKSAPHPSPSPRPGP